MCFSDSVDLQIEKSIKNFDGSYSLKTSFEKLISMGELVDRLSIVNFKLFKLKDTVLQKKNDIEFCAWASVEDIKLCKERSRLKNALDEKLIAVIKKTINNNEEDGFNGETKIYG